MDLEYYDGLPITVVRRIPGGPVLPGGREVLEHYVERPLLEACQSLYDKNIRTIGSSANAGDQTRGYAWINIDAGTLSPANRAILDGETDKFVIVSESDGTPVNVGSIHLPVGPLTTIGELSARAMAVAELFEWQPMLWAPKHRIEDLRKNSEFKGLEDKEIIFTLVGEGYFYDREAGIFYLSEEHWQKSHQLAL